MVLLHKNMLYMLYIPLLYQILKSDWLKRRSSTFSISNTTICYMRVKNECSARRRIYVIPI